MLDDADPNLESLFSYGTLQQDAVQWATFNRTLDGPRDQLAGYRQGWRKIDDPSVLSASGKGHHPIIAFTGNAKDLVRGRVFRVTREELKIADDYAVLVYRRERVTLVSGREAWAYVDVRSAAASRTQERD